MRNVSFMTAVVAWGGKVGAPLAEQNYHKVGAPLAEQNYQLMSSPPLLKERFKTFLITRWMLVFQK
jgi:hypothetical protein